MALKIITPPATEPLTLSELKSYLRVDYSTDDTILTSMISAARIWCEGYQNKKYITQTLELILDKFPCDTIEFSDCSPIQSVTSIKYYDTNGTEYTVSSDDYQVDIDSFVARIVPGYNKTWPTTTLKPANGVVIRFIAGYGNAASVPEQVKQAMVMHVRILYEACDESTKKQWENCRNALLGQQRKWPS